MILLFSFVAVSTVAVYIAVGEGTPPCTGNSDSALLLLRDTRVHKQRHEGCHI